MKTRKCSKCKKDLPLTREFFYYDKKGKYGFGYMCIQCTKENVNRCRKLDPEAKEKHTKRCREWRKKNPESLKKACNKYRKKNREFCNRLSANYKAKHKEYYKKYHTWYTNYRRKIDSRFNLNSRMSIAMGKSLKGNKNGKHWEDLVGYTLDDLKKHLEKQFKNGMTWSNYGKWHIDHIIPIKVFNFTKPEHIDFKRCWALSNLQPLWAKENLSKQGRLTKPFQPSLGF